VPARSPATPACATAPPGTASRSWRSSARTGDELWLDRARAFATHALAQVDRFRATDNRGRYSLFTGDVAAALLAAACLDGAPAFPGLDDL
jgi:hypothetical protein